jgi:hypothetical protein
MLVLLAALATVYRSGASDYWFHLGAGRAIREHGFPPREIWCLAAAGQVALLAGWPYRVALHAIHQLSGDLGVAAACRLTALGVGLGVRLLYAVQAATWPAWLLGLLLVSASRRALRVRPGAGGASPLALRAAPAGARAPAAGRSLPLADSRPGGMDQPSSGVGHRAGDRLDLFDDGMVDRVRRSARAGCGCASESLAHLDDPRLGVVGSFGALPDAARHAGHLFRFLAPLPSELRWRIRSDWLRRWSWTEDRFDPSPGSRRSGCSAAGARRAPRVAVRTGPGDRPRS